MYRSATISAVVLSMSTVRPLVVAVMWSLAFVGSCYAGVEVDQAYSGAARSLVRGIDFHSSSCAIEPFFLRVEFLEKPIGLSTNSPSFSWALSNVEGSEPYDRIQTAYELEVVDSNGALMWSSGEVKSRSSGPVKYNGISLVTHTKYTWRLRVHDGRGIIGAWTKGETFVTGVMEAGLGAAAWIEKEGTQKDTGTERFRKEFDIPHNLSVKGAFISACGLGAFDLEVNGRRLEGQELTPGWTNYKKSCLYNTFDVTTLVHPGKNAIGFTVGNGMYNVPKPGNGRYSKFVGSQGTRRMIARLTIESSAGIRFAILSDDSWKTTSMSPVTFTHAYAGEDYDARLNPAGWSAPGFDDSSWEYAVLANSTGCTLTGAYYPPIVVASTEVAQHYTNPQPGQYVFDLGTNMAGFPSITVSGKAGQTVKIIPGELLHPKFGNVSGISEASGPVLFQYTLSGEGEESWRAVLTYFGFRYLQVEGAVPLQENDLFASVVVKKVEGLVAHSSSRKIGDFETSDENINAVHTITLRAIESNMQSIFTDCPHREKLGWLEQLNLQETALTMNYDVSALFSKALRDMEESQTEDGLVPDISPEYTVFADGFRDSPEWGSSTLTVAYVLFKRYGDVGVLRSHYASMVEYMSYLSSKAESDTLQWGLGDWNSLADSAKGVTATVYYYRNALMMSEIASILGEYADHRKYDDLAATIEDAFNKRYFDMSTTLYGTGNQTDLAIPLVLGFARRYGPSVEGHLLNALVADIRKRGGGTTSGEIGYGYLLQALASTPEGMRLFYNMAMQPDKPSYLYMLNHGATALIETWNADVTASWNHFMLGHIEDWFYGILAGFHLDDIPNGRVRLTPKLLPGVLNYVKASHLSSVGLFRSEWYVTGGTTKIVVEIPPNVLADLELPCKADAPSKLTPGIHTFVCKP